MSAPVYSYPATTPGFSREKYSTSTVGGLYSATPQICLNRFSPRIASGGNGDLDSILLTRRGGCPKLRRGWEIRFEAGLLHHLSTPLSQSCVTVRRDVGPPFDSTVGPVSTNGGNISGIAQPEQHPRIICGSVAAIRSRPSPGVDPFERITARRVPHQGDRSQVGLLVQAQRRLCTTPSSGT